MSDMNAPGPRQPTKVAIIGAGLTGLIAAHGLKKAGFEVAVFERESGPDARRRDWTILIHWALPILAGLLPEDTLARLPQAVCNPHLDFDEKAECLPVYNGVTGELMFSSPTPGARRVTRRRMRGVLIRGLEGDIRWGRSLSRLESTDDSVTLTFDDGATFEADYVLGTDGASSKVRELLLGAEVSKPVPSGFMFATGIVKYGDAGKVKAINDAHPVTAVWMGAASTGGIGVMDVGDTPEDLATWTTFWVSIWRGPTPNMQGQEGIDYVKEQSKTLAEPFKSAIDWTPDGSTCYVDQMKYWIPTPFPNHGGRVALAGDALHPMLPFRGQGLQHAILDARNYVDGLVKVREAPGTRREVMSAVDAEMIKRGAAGVKQALQEAENAFDSNTVSNMLMARRGHGRIDDS